MKNIGTPLWVLGIVIFCIAVFAFDVTIDASSTSSVAGFSARVVNLQLQQYQLIGALTGLALFVSGIVLYGIGCIADELAGLKNVLGAAIPTDSATSHEPEKRSAETDRGMSPEALQLTPSALMEMHGITKSGDKYQYGEFKYDKLEDAVRYARIEAEKRGT